MATLRQSQALASGSTLAMTFMRPVELVGPDEQLIHRATDAAARAAGTPFISYYAPEEIVDGPRRRLRDDASCDGRRLRAALLRRSIRWPSAVHDRRVADGDDLGDDLEVPGERELPVSRKTGPDHPKHCAIHETRTNWIVKPSPRKERRRRVTVTP